MAEQFNNAPAPSRKEFDDLSAHLENLIQRISTSASVPGSGGTATIAYPAGFNTWNTIIVNQYLAFGATAYLYPSAVVETLQSDGIHVKNGGGAAGIIYVDIAKVGG